MPSLHIYNGEKRFLLQKLLARSVSVQRAMELCCMLPEGSETTSGRVFLGVCLSR
jgi:hypothetical protein